MMTPQPAVSDTVSLARLAREIATNIKPVNEVLDFYRIDTMTWSRIERDPKFQEMLGNMIAEWNAANNTRARVKMKAQTAVEALMDDLISEIMGREAPLSSRLDAYKQLCKLGELEAKDGVQGGGASSGVSITINIQPQRAPVTLEGSLVSVPETIDG